MRLARTLLFFAVLLVPGSAGAVTVRDIIELSKAGLSEDILVALIEADLTVFTLDKDQILELKKAGVSDVVVLKMLRTRAGAEPAAGAAREVAQQPGLVVIGAESAPAPAPVVVQQVVQQYFYVPYFIWGAPRAHGPLPPPKPVLDQHYRGFGRFINDGWIDRR